MLRGSKIARAATALPLALLLLGYVPWMNVLFFFVGDEMDRWEMEHGYEEDSWTIIFAAALVLAVALALTRVRRTPTATVLVVTAAAPGLLLALSTVRRMAHSLTRDPQGHPLDLWNYWRDGGFIVPSLVALTILLGWGLWSGGRAVFHRPTV